MYLGSVKIVVTLLFGQVIRCSWLSYCLRFIVKQASPLPPVQM